IKLLYLIIELGLVLKHCLGPLNVQQDVGQSANGILVATHHHIGKPHKVKLGTAVDSQVKANLFVKVNIFQGLESLVVISQERVQSEKSNQTEIAKHLVERVLSKLSSYTVWIT
ncbi:hypothetical protein EGW08_017396, partial [Elysia chlorotica]